MSSAIHDPVPLDAMLQTLVDEFVHQLMHDELAPSLIHVRNADLEGFDLGYKALDGHPSELLMQFRAPADWHALGLVSTGWAYHHTDRSDGRKRHRVFTGVIVSRSGEIAHRTIIPDRPELADRLSSETLEGEQLDLIRCALGLDTPPPPVTSAALFAIDWIVTLLDVDASSLSRWDDLIVLHPGARFAGMHDVAISPVKAARVYASVNDWKSIRAEAAGDLFPVPELVGADAAWLDEGAFARFVLSRCPPLSMLRSQLRSHVGADLADLVDVTLGELGVPTAVWPEPSPGVAAA